MIVHIRGVLVEKEPTRAVIEAAGVGYELIIPLSAYELLPRVGQEAKLLTYHSVREDDETLYGFATADEKELFEKLISVSGVGPKIAIAILSGSSVGELSLAITGGNAKRISAIKGVGKKTAEKICIELKDKVDAFVPGVGRGKSATQGAVNLRDAVLALGALGFAEDVANKMVAEVLAAEPELENTQEIIKKALSGGKK